MGAGKSKGKKGGEAPKVAKKSSAFAGNSFDDKVEEMVNQIKAAKGTTSRKDTYVRHATHRWTQSRCLFLNKAPKCLCCRIVPACRICGG